jgi:hypothetical protein
MVYWERHFLIIPVLFMLDFLVDYSLVENFGISLLIAGGTAIVLLLLRNLFQLLPSRCTWKEDRNLLRLLESFPMIALKYHNAHQECDDSSTRTDQQGQGEKDIQQQAHKDSHNHTVDDGYYSRCYDEDLPPGCSYPHTPHDTFAIIM